MAVDPGTLSVTRRGRALTIALLVLFASGLLLFFFFKDSSTHSWIAAIGGYMFLFVLFVAPVVGIYALYRIMRYQAVALVVNPISQEVERHRAESRRIYNDLPDLGKARVDQENAQKKRYVAIILVWVGLLLVLVFLPPLGATLMACYFLVRWGARAWRDTGESIEEASERRRKMLSGLRFFHGPGVTEESSSKDTDDGREIRHP
jgi:hypothetical protein